jgi:D-aminopeptidase
MSELESRARPRARDLGIPFDGTAGPFNAITDIDDVMVGHVTLIWGKGKLEVGNGPVRTGVTAIHPLGKQNPKGPVFAAWYTLNGNGEMTGTIFVEESGLLNGPILITNTYSVGGVRDAVIATGLGLGLPLVAETYDGFMNDIKGFHVKPEHVFEALDKASTGPVVEGNVGGGTGMICHDFKGGVGTASRKLDEAQGGYTVGVLVQANHGDRRHLSIAGVPVGSHLTDLMPEIGDKTPNSGGGSSIIVVVATDAPLLPHQLKRLAKRVPLGIGKVGGLGENFSGDIFIAFSTANAGLRQGDKVVGLEMLQNSQMDPLFEATVQATEEAIVNALVAAETMTGVDENTVYAIPHDRLKDVLREYNRCAE